MSKKKIIICFAIIVGISTLLIYNGRKPSLEKVKKQLLLTKKVRVTEITLSDQPISCPEIQEEETIQEIVEILRNSNTPPKNQWYSLVKYIDYHLEFLDKENKVSVTLETQSSGPAKLKRKGYKYSILIDDEARFREILKKHCEKVKD